jgi:Uma2 family endonuclease
MSTETTTKHMTAREFSEWVLRPENQGRHYELERGKVVEVSRPGERHGLVCANVVTMLNLYVRKRRRGYALSNDPGVILERDPDTVRGPDVVYFETSKKYDDMNPKFIEDPPTLAVEVLSPNDRLGKTTRRVREFLKAGVRLVWVIDPEARDVTVYRPGQDDYVVEAGQELTGDEVLPDFRCAVAEFFFSPEEEPGQATA